MPSRRLRIALVVSLLVNLFLLGAIVGGAVQLRHGRGFIAAGSLRIAGSELPRAERRAFRAALRDARASVAPLVREAGAAKRRAAMLLRRPSLDQTAILAALAEARCADANVRAAVETRAVMFAATLPAADRARLAAAMDRRAAHRADRAAGWR